MCLAVPGKILSTSGEDLFRVARVSFGGTVKEVSLAYVPEAEIEDYVLVHAGFAISKVDAETAEQTLEDLRRIGALQDELAEGEEALARAATRPQSSCPDGSCEAGPKEPN